jgi:hypothetical protein
MSMQMARDAMARVWSRWGRGIPAALRRYRAEDVFVFHSERSTFDFQFNLTYLNVFKKAGDLKCQPFEVGDQLGGFVTAIKDHARKKVHLFQDNFNREYEKDSLLCHEYIHWLSHGNFFPGYYAIGGDRPFRVEGVTDWLNLECFAPGTRTAAYGPNVLKTVAWLNADTGNLVRMMKFVFEGEETDLSSIHP